MRCVCPIEQHQALLGTKKYLRPALDGSDRRRGLCIHGLGKGRLGAHAETFEGFLADTQQQIIQVSLLESDAVP